MRLQQPLGQRARVGIIGIETRDDAIDQPGIGRVVRKHADAIERATGRHQSARAPAALARFVADQMVERRRDPPRPRRVCAQREGNKSRCNRDRRSRTRATADIGAVIGVAGNAEGAARADEAGRELVEIGLAHAQGPGGFELRHDICRMSRSIGKGRAAGGGFEPVDVDIVLHREGNARQRKRVAGGDPRVDALGLRAKPFCRCATDPDLRLDRVVSLDPRKRFVQHGKRGGFATVHCRRDLRGTLAFTLAHARLDSAMSGAPGSIGWRSSM